MNLTVELTKVNRTIVARVVQNNRRGLDMLSNFGITTTEQAKQSAYEILTDLLSPLPAPTVHWVDLTGEK